MTVRNIKLYKLNASNVQQEIDDSKTAYIEVFHKTETLVKLFQAHKANEADAKVNVKVEADSVFAFNKTKDNLHRLSKQMRASQRRSNIYLSKDSSQTHYVYRSLKLAVSTRNVKETSVVNRLQMYHLYEAKNVLSAEDFTALAEYVQTL